MLIKQNNKVQIDIGPEKVIIYECTGKVHSIFDFARDNKNILNEKESIIIEKNLNNLKKTDAIPGYLNKCFARSDDFKLNKNSFKIKRSGARSAYWIEKRIKFKGCRPMLSKPATFPMEKLEFGSDKIEYGGIPFGVLTKEAILREILAYCFYKENNLEIAHTPICVYEYSKEEETIGYCLVVYSIGETRVEQFINYPELTLNELIKIKSHGLKTNHLIGSELNLMGLNVHQYSEEKAKILINMHFSGGFRGILNSNIGNDIIIKETNNKLLICDFDTFNVINIPRQPDLSFLKGFIMYCVIETLKGSISIFDFYQLNEESTLSDYNKILFKKYTKTSSLWKAYERYFWLRVKENCWDENLVNQAFEYILKTQTLFKILSLVIPNNKAINEIVNNRTIFYSHD